MKEISVDQIRPGMWATNECSTPARMYKITDARNGHVYYNLISVYNLEFRPNGKHIASTSEIIKRGRLKISNSLYVAKSPARSKLEYKCAKVVPQNKLRVRAMLKILPRDYDVELGEHERAKMIDTPKFRHDHKWGLGVYVGTMSKECRMCRTKVKIGATLFTMGCGSKTLYTCYDCTLNLVAMLSANVELLKLIVDGMASTGGNSDKNHQSIPAVAAT